MSIKILLVTINNYYTKISQLVYKIIYKKIFYNKFLSYKLQRIYQYKNKIINNLIYISNKKSINKVHIIINIFINIVNNLSNILITNIIYCYFFC